MEEKIIERAQKKLYLDAAVIQQGRLAETSKALSKDEMLSMIRFGADAVFKSKGDDEYTDADIDTLIRRGEEPHISPVSPVHLASPLYLP